MWTLIVVLQSHCLICFFCVGPLQFNQIPTKKNINPKSNLYLRSFVRAPFTTKTRPRPLSKQNRNAVLGEVDGLSWPNDVVFTMRTTERKIVTFSFGRVAVFSVRSIWRGVVASASGDTHSGHIARQLDQVCKNIRIELVLYAEVEARLN